MKKSFLLKACACAVVLGFLSVSSVPTNAAEPVKLIYDTDMGNDIDDVFALAMINNLEKRGEIDFLAMTITKDNKYAAPYCQMIDVFYGNPDVPIGIVKGSGVETFDGKYTKQSLEAKDENGNLLFPFYNYKEDKTEYMEATALLRKTLAAQEDGSVVIAQVGFSTNLARLLDSPADDYSPLTGRELAAKKVKYVVAMAGNFRKHQLEYNVMKDVPAAQKFFAEWPTPIYASGFEVGERIFITGDMVKNDYEYVKYHPLKEAFKYYRGTLDANQCTWDLTTILFAARQDQGFFTLSEPGKITVDAEGYTSFAASADGNARFFIVDDGQCARVQEAFKQLCSEKL